MKNVKRSFSMSTVVLSGPLLSKWSKWSSSIDDTTHRLETLTTSLRKNVNVIRKGKLHWTRVKLHPHSEIPQLLSYHSTVRQQSDFELINSEKSAHWSIQEGESHFIDRKAHSKTKSWEGGLRIWRRLIWTWRKVFLTPKRDHI